jgi:Zn-dependent protease
VGDIRWHQQQDTSPRPVPSSSDPGAALVARNRRAPATRSSVAGARHLRGPYRRVISGCHTVGVSEQRTPSLPGGWLPPTAHDAERAAEPQPSREPQPSQDPFGSPQKPWWRRAGGAVVAAVLVAVKFGAKLKAVLLLLPKLKLLTTSGSMLVSIGAYSLIWGWKFAIGFVLLLFIHEMGHVIQLRREGIKASAPVFIPFMGALVWAKSLGNNALAEARVGLAGPILGTLGAAACIPIAGATGNEFWKALAFTGFFLNLFNLLPVVPLDGGRAMAAMSPWMWGVGLLAILVLAFTYPNPIILLIGLFALMETWRRWRAIKSGDESVRTYYRVKPAHRVLVAAVYIGLIALLVVGMDATHVARTFSDT